MVSPCSVEEVNKLLVKYEGELDDKAAEYIKSKVANEFIAKLTVEAFDLETDAWRLELDKQFKKWLDDEIEKWADDKTPIEAKVEDEEDSEEKVEEKKEE